MFRLNKGEVGVAMNADQSTAYVIQVNETGPDVQQRSATFFANSIRSPGLAYLARDDNQRVLGGWYQDLLESYDVIWERDPSASQRR
jgi:hypothetical protein